MSEASPNFTTMREIVADTWPRVTFDHEHQTVDVWRRKGDQEKGVEPYWINWDRIDSPEKLLGWIAHMVEKSWFTWQHTIALIELCRFRGVAVEYDA